MYKIISKYSKTGNLKYISHLDVLRFIQRSVKRAGICANYSEGFNPHMKTSFGFPLSLGNESIGEYFELEVSEKIDINEFTKNMNSVMPKEMQIIKAQYADTSDSIMNRCKHVEYLINMEFENFDEGKLKQLFEKMIKPGIVFNREKKNKKNKAVIKEIDTKLLIDYLKVTVISQDAAKIEATFMTTDTGSIKTDEFIKLIEADGFVLPYYSIMKIESLDKNKKPIL